MKKYLESYMRFVFSVILTFVAILLFILITSVRVKADVVRVWRPGLVTYVEAGQEIHYIVEEEDAVAFKNQKTVPINLEPFPKTDLKEYMYHVPNVTFCGEYKELDDNDL